MRFNKYTSILLTFLILASNMGMALNVHYCGGAISSVSFAYKQAEACGSKHNEASEACCVTITKSDGDGCCENDLVKLHDENTTKDVIVKSLQLDLGAFYMVSEWKSLAVAVPSPLVTTESPSFYCDSHAPPLFKLYCQYIFYA